MKFLDASGFITAMKAEIKILIHMNVFRIVQQTANMDVWALKTKQYPNGRVNKLKAHYCAHGFKQTEGVDYPDFLLW